MPLDLNYFWTCVRVGSLTAAACELHLSQSALSLQLKSLENARGRRLFDRGARTVVVAETDDVDLLREPADPDVREAVARVFSSGPFAAARGAHGRP